MDAPETVLLGLGSNLGEPIVRLAEAVLGLGDFCDRIAVSSVYRSEPVGYADQPDFLNLVATARTTLSAEALLDRLQALELRMGRTRSFRNAPRPIDLDILAYGEAVIQSERLSVPHPRLHQRAFVLVPLAEVAPRWRHPVSGLSAAEMIRGATRLERVERLGRLPVPG